MILLSHGGHENAVEAREDQKLGNPLLLRLPLDTGVKVIIAHGASLGRGLDIDDPERGMVNNFDLFLRLMDEKKYEGLVFGDISAQLQFNRLSEPLKKILERPDLHHRLVNGSDYPLPAMNLIIMTSKLSRLGFITSRERTALNEIYRYNPLLFDFVLKRTVRHPKTRTRFSIGLFHENAGLEYK
jgi:mannonate dehydratase